MKLLVNPQLAVASEHASSTKMHDDDWKSLGLLYRALAERARVRWCSQGAGASDGAHRGREPRRHDARFALL